MDNVERTPIKVSHKYVILQEIGKFPWKQRCRACGQYTLPGDMVYLIYPESSIQYQKDTYGQTLSNLGLKFGIIHKHEFEGLLEKIPDEYTALKFLAESPQPRAKKPTPEQRHAAEAFCQVCSEMGFRKSPSYSGREMKVGKHGSSAHFTFDMLTYSVGFEYRGRHGLLDGLYTHQLVTTALNKFDVAMGKENPTGVITAQSIVNTAIQKTKEMLGE